MPSKKATTNKAPAKKAAVKKAPVKKATTKKAPAKKAAVKKAPAKKAAVKKAPSKKAPAKKAAVKKPPVKKAPAKKAPAKKAAVKKAPAAKAAPAKKAVKKAPPRRLTSPYDAKFLEAQREALLIERQRRVHDAEALTAEANELAMLREPGDVQFDEESGEGDTLAVERERDLALSAQFRSEVEEIDRALEKIIGDTYGICEISGQAIPKERLRAIPWARERVEYKAGGFGRR